MKKRYKWLEKNGKLYILHWSAEGRLFGADWDSVAGFEANPENRERCKTIIRLMNECDKHLTLRDDDREGNTNLRAGL